MEMEEQLKRITRCRAHAVNNHPFFGVLALYLRVVRCDQIKTWATDGRHLFYNQEWTTALSDKQLYGVMVHEIMHNALLHSFRRGNREPRKWNIACDFAINNFLKKYADEKRDTGVKMEFPKGCFDEKYKDMSAEEIYALLPEGCCKGYVSFGDVIDADGMKPMEQAEVEALQRDWKIQVLQAAETAKQRGSSPACVSRIIGEVTQPKIDWREQLREFIVQISNDDYTFTRPNRRYLSGGIILPSLRSERMGALVVAIDTSGSVGQKELEAFFSEVFGIADSCKPSEIIIIQCDAAIGHVQRATCSAEIEVVATGGGGTSFVPVFDWVTEELRDPPAALVYMTDMYGEFPESDPGYPVLWAATTEVKGPFGRTIKLELS